MFPQAAAAQSSNTAWGDREETGERGREMLALALAGALFSSAD